MTVLNTIKREIRKSCKKWYKPPSYDYYYPTPSVNVIKCYHDIYSNGYKTLKLGSSKYKIEIIFNNNYVICIDSKKVLIFDDRNLPCSLFDNNEPFFESYTISNEDFFNLSMQNVKLLTDSEIKDLRQFMNKNYKNKIVQLWYTDIIIGNLVPDRW